MAAAACSPAVQAPPPAEVEVRRAPAVEVDPERRPLTEAEIDAFVAFTRLYGYVRFFHPSDGALVNDWDALAVKGAAMLDGPKDPKELARALTELFHPAAPTVNVHPSGVDMPLSLWLLPPGATTAVVAWRHDGLGTGMSRLFSSRRVDDRPRREVPGTLAQAIDATALRGKRVRVRGFVRYEPPQPPAGTRVDPRVPADPPLAGTLRDPEDGEPGALFGLHVGLPGGLDGFVDVMEDRPITSRAFQPYEVTGEVDADAETLSVVLQLRGEGRAFLDDVTLELLGPRGAEPIPLANAGFEDAGPAQASAQSPAPVGWSTREVPEKAVASAVGTQPRAPETPGYRVERSRDKPYRGRAAACIASVPMPVDAMPRPANVFRADLGAGVACEVPLSLYYAEGRTYPRVAWPAACCHHADPFAYDPRPRASRFASVVILWSTLWAFYPYFDAVQVDWPAELRRALARAAVDRDERGSLATLRRLMAAIHDGNGTVHLDHRDPLHGDAIPVDRWDRGLPVLWDWVDDRLVVTAVRRSSLSRTVRPGDTVVAIDGVPARDAIDAMEREVSAATPGHARWEAMRRLGVAPMDRSVALTIQPRAEEAFTVRAPYELPLGTPAWISEPRPGPVEELEPGIVYLDLTRVGDDGLDRALPALAAAKGIVMDLRGAPGGISLTALRHLLDAPVESPRWYVPRVTRPDREGLSYTLHTWTLTPAEPRLRAKVAFLADARALGPAETFLDIVERYRLGDIVGAPTAGTNGTVNGVHLPGGYRVTFTGTKVVKRDGSRHHGVGIQPTIPAARTIAGIAAGDDEILLRAVEAVRGTAR